MEQDGEGGGISGQDHDLGGSAIQGLGGCSNKVLVCFQKEKKRKEWSHLRWHPSSTDGSEKPAGPDPTGSASRPHRQ